MDGHLATWLRERYEEGLADEIEQLDLSEKDLARICGKNMVPVTFAQGGIHAATGATFTMDTTSITWQNTGIKH